MKEVCGTSPDARRVADRIVAHTDTIDPGSAEVRGRLSGAWDNSAYVLESVKRTIRRFAPSYPGIDSIRFELPRTAC